MSCGHSALQRIWNGKLFSKKSAFERRHFINFKHRHNSWWWSVCFCGRKNESYGVGTVAMTVPTSMCSVFSSADHRLVVSHTLSMLSFTAMCTCKWCRLHSLVGVVIQPAFGAYIQYSNRTVYRNHRSTPHRWNKILLFSSDSGRQHLLPNIRDGGQWPKVTIKLHFLKYWRRSQSGTARRYTKPHT